MVLKRRVLKQIAFITLAILAFFAILPTIDIYASDVSDAQYSGIIRIINSGVAAQGVSVPFTLSTADLISIGLISSNFTNVAIHSNAGLGVVFMPAKSGSTSWVVYTPSIGTLSTIDYILYAGGSSDMGGKIRYFPGTTGMTVSDNDTNLEPSDNCTITISGRIDTTNGTNKNIIHKQNALSVFVSPTVSGNITCDIGKDSPDSHTDVSGDWYNETAAYDGNIATSANTSPSVAWSGYLNLTPTSGITISKVLYYVTIGSDIDSMSIDIYYGGSWVNVFNALPTQNDWCITGNLTSPQTITNARVRFHYDGSGSNYNAYLYELGFLSSSISITGIESGEHDVKVVKNNTFLGLGIDNNQADTPLSTNLTVNLPFWFSSLNGTSPITSVDSNSWSTNVSGATWTAQGRMLDGIDDYLAINDNDLLSFGNGTTDSPFSIPIWFRFNSLPPVGKTAYLAQKIWSPGSYLQEYSFYIDSTGTLFFILTDYSESAYIGKASSANMTRSGEWYHLTATYSGNSKASGIKLYRDAALIDYSNISSGTYTAMENLGKPLYIGGLATNTVNGTIGEFQLYSKELSATEVEQLYLATEWKYKTSPHLDLVSESSVISNGSVNGWGSIVQASNGNLVACYVISPAGNTLGKISTDGGLSWGSEFVIKAAGGGFTYGGGKQTLLSDGTILNVFSRYNGAVNDAIIMESNDNGSTWTQISTISSDNFTNFGHGHIAKFSDGTLIIPIEEFPYGAQQSIHCQFSTDGGHTWGNETILANGDADNHSYNETTILVTGASSAIALIRKGDTEIDFYQTSTIDKGQTWSVVTEDRLLGSSKPGLLLLSNGGILAKVRKYTPMESPGTTKYAMIYYSDDNGATAWDFISRFDDNDKRTNDGNMVEFSDGSIGVLNFQSNASETECDGIFRVFTLNDVSDDRFNYTLSTSAIPNTPDNWVFFQNDVMPYVEYAEVKIGGTQRGYWSWEYAATFSDQSDSGNTATPSFRTVSSHSQVSESLVSFTPATLAKATDWLYSSYGSMVTVIPGEPADMYSELSTSHIPGNQFVVDIFGKSNTPVAVFWFTLPFVLSILVGIFVYQHSRSLFAQWGLMTLILIAFASMGPIPYWPVYLFTIDGIGLMVASKSFGW